MAIEVRPITLPKDAAAFIDVWWTIYKGDPYWVPPLRFERKEFLDPGKNPYLELARVQLFIAYKDGAPVGTISAQVDQAYQKREPGVGFFGFFEFIDDKAVSKALFDAALEWLRGQGMRKVMGPFNFNTNHECTVQIDGFDGDPLVMMVYNHKYYVDHYEALGVKKEMDFYAYWLENNGPIPERVGNLADRFMERHPEVKIRPANLKDYDNEVRLVKDIYNDAWSENWGSVPLTDKEFDHYAKGLRPMVDPRFCYFAYVNDEVAAFALTLPDFNQVVKPMNGRIFPFGWYYWLTMPKKVNRIRIFALGVKKKFQHLALGAPLYKRTWEEGQKANVTGGECSWILENNVRMRGAIEKMGGKIYRTYRIYGTDL